MELTSDQNAIHILNRFSFGPKRRQVKDLAGLGKKSITVWFEDQLNRSVSDSPAIAMKLASLKSLKYSNAQMLKAYPQQNAIEKLRMDESKIEGKPQEILRELLLQKFVRAVESENQVLEVMTDFWFNHFNVFFEKGVVRHSITSFERDIIRPRVFGNFEDMLLAVAKSPAMLLYLDNNSSKKNKINENYARELMELHTLGVDSGYRQSDIQEAARVLTGWGVEKPREVCEFKFFKRQHDNGPKKVLEINFNGGGGISEGEKLIKYLARHPSTAKFIAKKLAIKFISDQPETETITSIATAFTKSGGDLKETYRAVINSKEFFETKTFNAKIKTPFEFVVSAARVSESEITIGEERINKLKSFFDQSGQPLYRCQPPTGFKAVSEVWVNAGAMVNRINFAMALTADKIPHFDFSIDKLNKDIESKKFSDQMQVLEYYDQQFLNSTVSSATLKKINNLILDSNNYFTEDTKQLSLHYFNTRKLFALMLSSPEFQRR